jgi:YcaO-like protein with predicted kinase domain
MRDSYSAICSSLGLDEHRDVLALSEIALSSPAWGISGDVLNCPLEIRTTKRPDGSTDLSPFVFLHIETNSCVVIDPRLMLGCEHCFVEKALLHQGSYEPDSSECPTIKSMILLTAIFYHFHGLLLGVTQSVPEQNWSLLCPLPHCRVCGGGASDWAETIQKKLKPHDGELKETYDVSSSRAMTPVDFVRANRYAIGFCSVVGNVGINVEFRSFPVTYAPIFVGEGKIEVAGGKGATEEQSLASCIGEALERYYLVNPSRTKGKVSSYNDLPKSGRMDLFKFFGFPVNDEHPSVVEYANDLPIEWLDFTDAISGEAKLLPASFVYCPYFPSKGAHVISVGSTNGASAGANVIDATVQGALEVLERDAFSFYSRLGHSVVRIPDELVPEDVSCTIAELGWARFHVTLLPSTVLGVYVCQVVMVSSRKHDAQTARGTGATFNLQKSIRRAFAECIQMYISLSGTMNEVPSDLDMRDLWRKGAAKDLLSCFFNPIDGDLPKGDGNAELMFQSAAEQGLRFFRHVLAKTERFAVVKVLATHWAVSDPTYFANNKRFSQIEDLLGLKPRSVEYRNSLFM